MAEFYKYSGSCKFLDRKNEYQWAHFVFNNQTELAECIITHMREYNYLELVEVYDIKEINIYVCN